jgi:methanogenic corrinoid protein MtbC1
MELTDKQKVISELISNGEKDKAIKKLKDWALLSDFKTVIFEILEPMLVEWGKLWMQGQLSLAHGYLSGKVAEEFYMEASKNEEFKQSNRIRKGTIILGNIEDDFHPLGRKLVNIYSQAAGWNIIDLGTDVTAEIFIEKAIEHNADVIAVSAMMFTTAKNISKVREQIEKHNLSGVTKLAVGGAVFKLRPELVQQVGGDGTAETAIDAPALFERLVMKTKA